MPHPNGRSRPWRRRVISAFMALALLGLVPAAVEQPTSAADPVIAYPNLRVLVPASSISIAQPTVSTRTLNFAHITWNAGAGPYEMRPTLNPATGVATATQALYTLTGPSTWSFVRTVPIVKPMVWDPPSDYRFPLTGFGLYQVAAGGGLGALISTSPKVDYCITPDKFVGGVPNTAPTASPPVSNCTNPNGALGLSVGWGDQYDYNDAGNNIDISNLPNGTYWLRAQADPGNYIAQQGPNQSITDTKLTISGTTVTVVQQVNPAVTLPVVTVTNPLPNASIAGPVTLSATVADANPVTSVQFLLDGLPVGAPQTSSPYSLNLPALNGGPHTISAQALDAAGMTGTAPAVPVTAPLQVGAVQVDQQISATGNTTIATPAFSTAAANEQLLAFVGSDAPPGKKQTMTVTGGGLTWNLVKRSNVQPGDAEIWSATAPAVLTNIAVTATATLPGKNASLTVLTVQNSVGIGASSIAGGTTGAPAVALTTTGSGSMLLATGNDYDRAAGRTLGPAQALVSQWLDTSTG
ncbi:MAG TPA: Ig-like domain-containing protein, partial [Acidimicrobiales bacterium]